MQLQIKHLAPYLPYDLLVYEDYSEETFLVCGFRNDNNEFLLHDNLDGSVEEYRIELVKPLLYPLENLLHDCPEEIRDEFSKMDWERFKSWIEETSTWLDYLGSVPSLAFIKMIELKYDVFRLIPQGLALDINTVVTK